MFQAFVNITLRQKAVTTCRQDLQLLQLTYLLTARCRVLLEKLTGLQLVKKFPAFHGTRRFITAFTSVRHLSLSQASPIQSIYPHPTSWRSILILSTHLRLDLLRSLSLRFPHQDPTPHVSSPIRATCPVHLILLHFITRTILGEEYTYVYIDQIHKIRQVSYLGRSDICEKPHILLGILSQQRDLILQPINAKLPF